MIGDSFKEVRHAVSYRGFNEVDEVDRPQSGGAGCGRFFARRAQTLWCKIAAQLFAVIEESNLTG